MPTENQSGPRFPGPSNRTVIIGPTGSGKTVAGLWHLSNYDLENDPWVVLNFKGDEHIDSIPNTQEIGYDYVPKKKDRGLFILRPRPDEIVGSGSPLNTYIGKIWERGRCGIFADEGFMLKDCPAYDHIQTQGRSLLIPTITNTQRPVWVSRYVFSEASFIQCFDINDERDIDTVESFVPLTWDDEAPLQDFQSWYYDVGRKKLWRFQPVPKMKETLKTFDKKLYRKYVVI